MKILVPVSIDSFREDAACLAIDTSRALRAEIRLLSVVDREGIRRAESGAPPGAIHIAQMAEKEIAERQEKEKGREVLELGRRCREAGVPCTGEVKTGDPLEEIEKASAGCDLLVSGLSSQYSFEGRDEPGKLVLSLMNERVIPLLLAASPYRPVKTVVIGCGGGLRTERAIGAMAHFGLWKEKCRIILLVVDDSPEQGVELHTKPRKILTEACYAGWEEKVVSGTKVETFLAFCQEEGADAVVLGGWGKRRWNEFFGSSITGRLLDLKRFHMFLYM